jgi:tetratricopeptide (TPR) repeat protein
MYHLHNGALAEAYKRAEEGYTLGARIGASISPILASYMLGHIAELQGNYDAAMEWHRKGLQHARPLADFLPFMLVIPLGGLGMICLDISDELKDRAMEYHAEAANLLSTPMGMPGGGTAWADLGFCALELGYPDVAYERFQNGLNIPSMLMYVQKPRLLAGAALAAQALGKTEEGISFLDEAHRYAEEGDFKWFYPLIALVDARVSSAQGNTGRALEQYKLAETLAREMGIRHIMWQAQLGAAQLLRTCGNMVESSAMQANAQQTIDELTASFEDDTYKEAFRESMARKIA